MTDAPRRAGWNPALTFFAGLAAGLLLMAVAREERSTPRGGPVAAAVFTNAATHAARPSHATAPPLASTRGPLARMGGLLRR